MRAADRRGRGAAMMVRMVIGPMLAGLALAVAGVASAQADDKRTRTPPNPVAPPALTVPPAPPVVTNVAPPLRVLGSAPLPDLPGTTAELVVVSDRAAIRLRDGQGERYATIDSVVYLLELLADRRMMPLWPALTNWAGTGAETLRDQQIEAARRAFADVRYISPLSTAESATGPKTRALLRLATRLDEGGRRDEAIALLAANRPASPGKTDTELFDWVAIATRASGIYRNADHYDRAIAVLDEALAAMGDERYFSVNLMINRAALLAESGRHAEALKAVDAALAAFKAGAEQFGTLDRVPGSGREFSWVRACALRGLGRVAEADAEAAAMLADTNPTDPQFVLKPTTDIAIRYAICVDDRQLAVRVLAEDLASRPFGSRAFTLLQPGRVRPAREAALLRAVRDDPAMAKVLGGRLRVLPDALLPALNRWRAPSAPPAPSAH